METERMPNGQPPALARFLRRLVAGPGAGGEADRKLLRRFAVHRDEAAFAALVGRHGPLVWGVCRRVLGHEQDAEDAFQATLLVLARKAGSLSRPERLASWLYGVADHTARKARVRAARRREKEGRVTAGPAAEWSPDPAWADLRPVLDEEVGRLPDRFRDPFVLCYLEGRTNEVAARLLGCPTGTVQSRLASARERLRVALARRGVALSAGSLAALEGEASAGVPAALAESAVAAALRFAARSSAGIPSGVTSLAEGVLQAMFLNRVKTAAAGLLVIGVLAAGAGVLAYQPKPADRAEAKQEPPAAVAKEREEVTELRRKKLAAAKKAYGLLLEEVKVGRPTTPYDVRYEWSKRWLEAELEFRPRGAERIAAF